MPDIFPMQPNHFMRGFEGENTYPADRQTFGQNSAPKKYKRHTESLAFIICLLLSLFHKNSINSFPELLRYINHEVSQFLRPFSKKTIVVFLDYCSPIQIRHAGARLAPLSEQPTRQDLQCQQRNNVPPPNGGEDS
jgi:hypothetical protein